MIIPLVIVSLIMSISTGCNYFFNKREYLFDDLNHDCEDSHQMMIHNTINLKREPQKPSKLHQWLSSFSARFRYVRGTKSALQLTHAISEIFRYFISIFLSLKTL